jgi:hypothetical protein
MLYTIQIMRRDGTVAYAGPIKSWSIQKQLNGPTLFDLAVEVDPLWDLDQQYPSILGQEYECIDCRKEFFAEEIHYLCPECRKCQ